MFCYVDVGEAVRRAGEHMTIIIRKLVYVAHVKLIQSRASTEIEVHDARDLGPENMPGSAKSREIARRRYERQFIRNCLHRRFY